MVNLSFLPYDIIVAISSQLSPFDRINLSRSCKALYAYQLTKNSQSDCIILSGLSTSHLVTDRFFAQLIDGMTEQQRLNIVHVDFEFASLITVHAVMMALTSFTNLRSLNCRYCRNIKIPEFASILENSIVQHRHLQKVYLGDWKMPISREWDDAFYTIEKHFRTFTHSINPIIPNEKCSRCHATSTPLSRICCQCKSRVWHCQEPTCYHWWSKQLCPSCNTIVCHDCRFKHTQSSPYCCEDADIDRRDECMVVSCFQHGRQELHISARPDLFCH
ncbi:hypothetical protein BGW37DRAFT_91336 [Umbelopsis sp. PMI_123]|nr:hypothetical protein BGW37DRAFT_91336 [Umbelopsis sp. PMI_123]